MLEFIFHYKIHKPLSPQTQKELLVSDGLIPSNIYIFFAEFSNKGRKTDLRTISWNAGANEAKNWVAGKVLNFDDLTIFYGR
jgi:hypothetical protein